MAARAKRHKGAKARGPARPRRAALGNDPFERGAAPREPVARAALQATPTPAPTPTPTSTSTRAPAPQPVASRGERPLHARRGVAAAAGGAVSRLEDVERRLDSALDGVESRLQELAARAGVAGAPGELKQAVARLWPAVAGKLTSAIELLRLLEPPERLDRFGMDPRFVERLEPVVELFCSAWWRVALRDVGNVPADGAAVVVANHAGAVPWDAFVLRHAVRRHRDLRPLLDDRECALAIVGPAAVRYGAVRSSAESAGRLLGEGQVIGVFPEGSAVAHKPWRERYRLQRFGRGGFAKVALRAGAPIVPCAIVGSEEASPGIARTGWLAERLGVPLLAANPSLRVAAAGLLPLPSRWTIRFGEPVATRDLGAAAADDAGVVNALTERVRARVQELLDEELAGRSSVYL